MFTSIPSVDLVLQCLVPAFTQPSFQTHVEVFLGWVMCLGKRTEYGVFQTVQADTPLSRKERHPFDRFYNFFSRSAWTAHDLAHQVAVAIVVRLNPRGLLYLVVDDTLLHKRGKHVYGLGWFRSADRVHRRAAWTVRCERDHRTLGTYYRRLRAFVMKVACR